MSIESVLFQVTTFLITILRWILFPVHCTAKTLTDPDTVSTWLRNDDSVPCTPWRSPEILLTLPSLFLAAVFVIFSFITTLLSFEANPTFHSAGSAFTGRVEVLWSAARVAAVLLGLLQSYTTPTCALVLFCALQAVVLAAHLCVLPFHSPAFNHLRAGIYAAVLWCGIASALVSSLQKDGDAGNAQWALLALTPLAFALGVGASQRCDGHALAVAKRLRAQLAADSDHRLSAPAGGWRVGTIGLSVAAASSQAAAGAGGPGRAGRAGQGFEVLFEPESPRSRAFESAADAHACIRGLLRERDSRGPFKSLPPDHSRCRALISLILAKESGREGGNEIHEIIH